MVSLTMNETFPVNCSGSYPSKVVQITTYSLLMASSLIGNLLVVGVFYKNKNLRTTVYYFIMNMAVSDLLFPLVYLPYCIVTTYLDYVWVIQGIVGNVLCKFTLNAGILSNAVSTLTMVLMAVDRFHGVVFPMRPPLFSKTKCRYIIICVWLAAVVLCSPFFYLVKPVPGNDNLFRCALYLNRLKSHEMTLYTATIIFGLSFSFGCALIVTVLYSSVVVRLYRQKRQLNLAAEQIRRRNKKYLRITWMLLTVVIVFYLIWIVVFIVDLMVFKNVKDLPCIYIWFTFKAIRPLYSAINPVVYYIYNKKYRQGFKDVLWFCCPCRAVTVQSSSRADNACHMNDAVELEQQ